MWAEHKGCTQPLQQSGVDVEGRKKEKKKGFDFQKSKFRQVTQRQIWESKWCKAAVVRAQTSSQMAWEAEIKTGGDCSLEMQDVRSGAKSLSCRKMKLYFRLGKRWRSDGSTCGSEGGRSSAAGEAAQQAGQEISSLWRGLS